MLIEKIKLDKDERVIKIVRKHWALLFVPLFGAGLMALFPGALFWVLNVFLLSEELASKILEYSLFLTYVYMAWLLVVWMFAFNAWTDYYLDVWTITNKRVLAIEQHGLFNRTVGSFRLENLQDLNIQIKGIVQTLLNFGYMEAQTASGDKFEEYGHPDPRELKAIILAAADERMKMQRGFNDFSASQKAESIPPGQEEKSQ